MLKICVLVFLACILGLNFQFSNRPSLDYLMFGKRELCSYQLTSNSLVKRYSKNIAKDLSLRNADCISLLGACEDKRVEVSTKDTLIMLADTFVDIKYANRYGSIAFDALLKKSLSLNTTSYAGIFADFIKPGKIFCLTKESSTIRMISMNSCAESKKFESIVNLIKKSNIYDEVLAIRCGGDVRSMTHFRSCYGN
jgi:hypothetical protein